MLTRAFFIRLRGFFVKCGRMFAIYNWNIYKDDLCNYTFYNKSFFYALTDSLTSEQSIHLIKHKYSISGKESSKCMSTNVVVWRSDTIVFCSIYKQKTTSIYLSHRRFYIQLRHIYTCRNATSALNVYYINAYLIYGTLRFLIKWTALDTLDSNHSLRGVSFLRPPIARGALNNAKW